MMLGLIEDSQDATWTALRVQVRLGQAIAQFWIKNEEAALEAFQHALDEAAGSGRDGVREDVAVLLARTLWVWATKTQRIWPRRTLWTGGFTHRGRANSSLGTEKPPIKVLTALASIAMASKDADLSEAVMSVLRLWRSSAGPTRTRTGSSNSSSRLRSWRTAAQTKASRCSPWCVGSHQGCPNHAIGWPRP